MKKKIMAFALIVVMLAIAVIGGTMAYFTDKEEKTNTFTAGNVDITLKEYGKNADGTIVPFSDAVKELAPGSSTTTVVYKWATITNDGKNDAYVWAELLIPAALTSDQAVENETNSALHYSNYGAFLKDYDGNKQTPVNDGIMDGDKVAIDTNCDYVEATNDNFWSYYEKKGTETIDGVEYAVFVTKMQSALPVGKTTVPFLRGVYMDNDVDVARNDDGTIKKDTYMIPKQASDGTVSFVEYNGTWEVIVRTYAIQADGFTGIDAAYTAFGTQAQDDPMD